MKILMLASVLVLSISCQTTDPCLTDPTATTCPETPVDVEPGPNVPAEAAFFEANLNFTNFDGAEEDKVHRAVSIIKKVIASSEFRDRVLNFSYNGKKGFVDNGGLSNAQIYQKLIDGQEDLKPGIDHEMDLDLELYYSSANTVGYTYPDVVKVWMNTKYFDSYTPVEVSDNLFHEWTHKLGFDHASNYSVSRDYSVPYGLGYLMEELGKKYQ